ncbi:MAG TPA: DUF2158 domain-containing protein [candidate division Zixibacteria bacterium]|jgi:uncharacterized protein YodC (DUF2158 family)|nr:DUF2158 domain-containing protein [candidate division Zixibacteria bacterium]
MDDFKQGDVVKLKSGGPKMTCAQKDSQGQWYCEWFNDNKVDGHSFWASSLRLANESEI